MIQASISYPLRQPFARLNVNKNLKRFLNLSYRTLSSSVQGNQEARLRFAPSPTGYLHLGGLRTALFNHLYARKLKGKWILRIEDTDQNRYVPGAVEALQRTLHWAKLDYDEGPDRPGTKGPYIQSQRLDLYRSYSEELIKSGKAYRDFRPEVEKDSYASKTKSTPQREAYIPPDEDEAKQLIAQGKPYVVRLKAYAGSMDHHDLVYGTIHFPADPNRSGTEDPILLKSTGWPTYHLANVVDDHEMGITHVLRGEEWLPSLPKHLWLYQALGLEPPQFAHLPLLMNADGTKLSKRTGDVRVEDYIGKGFEPEALNNFVALMGYNHSSTAFQDQDRPHSEVMLMQEMIDKFDITNVNHSRAVLDLTKLDFLNHRHLSIQLSQPESRQSLIDRARPLLANVNGNSLSDNRIGTLLDLTIGTITHFNTDLPNVARSILEPPTLPSPSPSPSSPLSLPSKLSLSILQTTLESFHQLLVSFPTSDPFSSTSLSPLLQQLPSFLPTLDKKTAKTKSWLSLRFGLTGQLRGPSLPQLMAFLGHQECQSRIQRMIQYLRSSSSL